MAGTDMIVFRRGAGVGDGQSWHHWTMDQWPPPARLCLVPTTEGIMICDPDGQDDGGKATLRASTAVLWFTRSSASEIEEPAPDGEDWFRGAEYIPALITNV